MSYSIPFSSGDNNGFVEIAHQLPPCQLARNQAPLQDIHFGFWPVSVVGRLVSRVAERRFATTASS
jgi:hypothetical protein